MSSSDETYLTVTAPGVTAFHYRVVGAPSPADAETLVRASVADALDRESPMFGPATARALARGFTVTSTPTGHPDAVRMRYHKHVNRLRKA